MAYKKEDLVKSSLKALKKNPDIIFIEDLCVEIGISKQTFYKKKMDEDDEIKEAFLKNKQDIKRDLRNKWRENDNATTQIALYRLASTPEEHRLLNQQYQEVTGKNGKDLPTQIIVGDIRNLDEGGDDKSKKQK